MRFQHQSKTMFFGVSKEGDMSHCFFVEISTIGICLLSVPTTLGKSPGIPISYRANWWFFTSEFATMRSIYCGCARPVQKKSWFSIISRRLFWLQPKDEPRSSDPFGRWRASLWQISSFATAKQMPKCSGNMA